MTDIVVLCGDPAPRSRTLALAADLGAAIAARHGAALPAIVDTGDLGADLLAADRPGAAEALAAVQEADLLVVATPTCTGTFSGVLKVLLDRLPVNALAGAYAVPVVTAVVQEQADRTEAALRRVLGELGADVADFGLTAVHEELADGPALVDRYLAAMRLTTAAGCLPGR